MWATAPTADQPQGYLPMATDVTPSPESTTQPAPSVEAPKQTRKRLGMITFYVMSILVTGVATATVAMLWQNINDRKREAEQHSFRVVELHDDLIDPAEWGKNYPRQYEGYLRTQEIAATKYGGSVNIQKMDKYPVYRTLFKGYPFAIDSPEKRGHPYIS